MKAYRASNHPDSAFRSRIPYAIHASAGVVTTKAGDCLQLFRLEGLPFETADDADINSWHERLSALLRSWASPQVALWTHLVRERVTAIPLGAAPSGFSERLASRYVVRLTADPLYRNRHYLTVLYRPLPGIAGRWASRWAAKRDEPGACALHAEALDACQKLRAGVLAGLDRYQPTALGLRKSGAWVYSEVLEAFASVLNGEWQPVPLLKGPLDAQLLTSRLLFGSEVLEQRTPTRTHYAAHLGIKEYPTPTVPGMLNAFLSAPMPLVLTQSFSFLSKAAAQGVLQRQHLRMRNAGDFAASQADALTAALDELSSNRFVLGDHHLSLQVRSDPVGPGASPIEAQRVLTDRVALARSLLADVGITTAREDLALEAATWAQLPGQFGLRPRKAPISSRNFAALSPWHDYPQGRETGNHWGESMATFRTRANTPFHFSLHASFDEGGGARAGDIGHSFIAGPTGSGKTVFMGFLVSALAARGVTQIVFDKDRGLDVLIRALDGEYLPLKNGVPTGFNPLQLPATPPTLEFQRLWLRLLVRGAASFDSAQGDRDPLSAAASADLDQALRGTLLLPVGERRLSRLAEFLDPTLPDGPYARLAPWCQAQGGEWAWVFDNPVDQLVPRLAGRSLMAFDVTDFLDHPVIRGPVTFYLFHLIRGLLDGRPLVCWMDEFSRLLADPAFQRFAQEGPNTWRKLNAAMCMATQGVRDVLQSPISRAIVEQTPTKILFANPEASAQDYCSGLGLTARELAIVRHELIPQAGEFLVKQGRQSVVCRLDLRGLTAELAVISGRAQSVRLVERLQRELGDASEAWLPAFLDQFPSPNERRAS